MGHRVGKQEGSIRKEQLDQLNPQKQIDVEIGNISQIRYTIDLTKQYHNLLMREEEQRTQAYFWDGNVTSCEENGRQSYYLQDELGSPLRIEDELGATKESYGYGAFGEDLYGNQGELQPFGYTGYQRDSIAGTYFAQAREYAPGVGRFLSVDEIKGTIENTQTLNLYKYCINSPFKYIDLTGCRESCIEGSEIEEIVETGLQDNAYGTIIDGLNISLATVGTLLKKAIVEEIRPNNIGKGIWRKKVASELDDVARIFGSSTDDVTRGFANSSVNGFFPKILGKLGYVAAGIDAVTGIKENIEQGSSWQKTTSDAIVDVTVSAGTIWAAGAAGAIIGGAAGTVVPGAGNIVGAIGGFAVGILGYVVTDVIKINGKSIRDNIKDGISKLFDWD